MTTLDPTIDQQLPPGVHPRDPSGPPDFQPQGPHLGRAYETGRPPWDTENDEALGVFQRAAHDWSPRIWIVSTSTRIANRQKGRTALVLAVPSKLPDGSTPNGVIIGADEGAVDQAFALGNGDVWVLNNGDSLTLPCEASVYAAPIKGNSTGACQVIDLYSPPGGGLGAP